MWSYNHTSYLEHAGVRGMRWGHRRARPDMYEPQRPRHTQDPYGGGRPRYNTIRGERVAATVLAGAGGAVMARSATRFLITRNKNAGLVAGIIGGALGATAITAINANNDRKMQEYEYDYYQ